ncbi:MAG: imidazolonepropionase [Firmicutes bacterium]|nr:imidazolonepropionase [Bacillota bacterium]MBQ4233746.1 imidazolonepropionase [Bacillota bacterium]
MERLLIKNIGMLATPEGREARRGQEQGRIRILKNAWILAEDGLIRALGEGEAPVPGSCQGEDGACTEVIDAQGCLVTPGLVDAHTHLIFGGWRQYEMEQKLKGVPYLEILASGGGILSTVRATKAASEDELYDKAKLALDEMLSFGTTTCEAKSGYGLDEETELRMLRAIKRLNEDHPIDLVPTFLGAHALPPEFKDDREAFISLLCDKVIPEVAGQGLAEYCDVFCESGVFTAEETRRILLAGQKHGLRSKVHADEIEAIGGSQLAGEIGAVSAEHLIVCPDEGIESMAKGGTVACLLPATSFYLGATFAPARKMIEAGVPVAMATDFNPGSCPCLNMQLVINLGCLRYRLTPEEVLTAVTLNGAAACGRAASRGSIEPGKLCDLVIWDAPDLNYICYRLGSNLAKQVIKTGKPV